MFARACVRERVRWRCSHARVRVCTGVTWVHGYILGDACARVRLCACVWLIYCTNASSSKMLQVNLSFASWLMNECEDWHLT